MHEIDAAVGDESNSPDDIYLTPTDGEPGSRQEAHSVTDHDSRVSLPVTNPNKATEHGIVATDFATLAPNVGVPY